MLQGLTPLLSGVPISKFPKRGAENSSSALQFRGAFLSRIQASAHHPKSHRSEHNYLLID